MIKNLAIFDCVRATAGTQRRERGVESVPFKAKNDAQTASELFKINFQKVQKKVFFTLKMVKMTLSEIQILT